jgi:hypothetical protein
MRATTNALLANQRDQFSEVLKAALKAAVPAAVHDAVTESDVEAEPARDETDLAQDLEQRITQQLEAALSRSSYTNVRELPSPDQKITPSPLFRELTKFPEEERGSELLGILEQLDPLTSATFFNYARITLERAEAGRAPTFAIAVNPKGVINKLVDYGLVSRRRMRNEPKTLGDGREQILVRLTSLGMEVASLLLGRGPIPKWIMDAGQKYSEAMPKPKDAE